MPTSKFNSDILTAAIQGYEHQKSRIEAQITELKAMIADGARAVAAALTPDAPKAGRKKMSAATRKKIGDAIRKAALAKKASGSPVSTVTSATTKLVAPAGKKPKRKLSAEGRRKIIEANKRMWAARRAKNSAPAAAKKAVAKSKATTKAS
jgi:hypothetical protein